MAGLELLRRGEGAHANIARDRLACGLLARAGMRLQPGLLCACVAVAACNTALDLPGAAGACASATDAASCNALPGCVLDVCADGEFVGCFDPGTHVDPCSTAPACAQITEESECVSRGDCHALYQPNDTCGCAAAFCCGGTFSSCAEGPTTCTSPKPLLEPPPYSCGDTDYVYSYGPDGSVDGCTRASECPGYCGGSGAPACPDGELCCGSPANPEGPRFCTASPCPP